MRAELRDALEFLYTDSQVSSTPCRALTQDVARGGTVAVHLLLNDLPIGARVRLSVTAEDAQWFRLVDVPVEKNTGLIGFTEDTDMGEGRVNSPNPYVTRRAPFRVFDAMEPLRNSFTASAPTQAVRLHLPVAPDAQPGEYAYTIQVSVNTETAEFDLCAKVHQAVIPPVGRDSFPVTNWFHLTRIATFHHLECWSEDHWRMIRRYAKLMAHGRQNTFLCSLRNLFERTADGPVQRRERLRRLVRLFTSTGMYYIEGGHYARRLRGFEDDRFVYFADGPLSTSAEGNADIACAAKQLMEEIDRNKWRDRWVQHASDEPNEKSATDYRLLCGIIRRHMPGIPIMDATCSRSLAGAVNLWCPHVHLFQQHQDFYAQQRETGDGVWYYTCCEPGGTWLNRLLDHELLRPVLLGWAGALYGLDGFLHWGLNSWQPNVSPFERSIQEHTGAWPNSLPAGDTHIVYPGHDGPWSSVRFEAHREGFEDVELLRQAQAANPQVAAEIMGRVLRSFDDYTTDISRFRAARRALLTSLQ